MVKSFIGQVVQKGIHLRHSSGPQLTSTVIFNSKFLLTSMHKGCILMHMRTTLNIDDQILEKASQLTGVKEKTALVRLGLEALIARESSKRLAKLGGTENNLRSIPRRRSA
jgi:Arc/MetJ family transcription regulator